MQEVGRLGSSSLTRTNEAYRELAEQAFISATVSTEALQSILQPTSPHHPGASQQPQPGPLPRTPPSFAQEDRTRKMRKVAPIDGETEEEQTGGNSSNVPLTAMERQLMETYEFFPDPAQRPNQCQQQERQHQQHPQQSPDAQHAPSASQPSSAPSAAPHGSSFKQSEPLQTLKEEESWGGSAADQSLRQFAYQPVPAPSGPHQCSVILDGGSSIEPFNPSRVLPTSSSPSAGGGSGHWGQPKMPDMGDMKMIREADRALSDGTGAIARGGNRIPHASVFGTYRHLKEDESLPGTTRDTINY